MCGNTPARDAGVGGAAIGVCAFVTRLNAAEFEPIRVASPDSIGLRDGRRSIVLVAKPFFWRQNLAIEP